MALCSFKRWDECRSAIGCESSDQMAIRLALTSPELVKGTPATRLEATADGEHDLCAIALPLDLGPKPITSGPCHAATQLMIPRDRRNLETAPRDVARADLRRSTHAGQRPACEGPVSQRRLRRVQGLRGRAEQTAAGACSRWQGLLGWLGAPVPPSASRPTDVRNRVERLGPREGGFSAETRPGRRPYTRRLFNPNHLDQSPRKGRTRCSIPPDSPAPATCCAASA